MLFDPPDAGIGWSAAVAAADGFVVLRGQGRRQVLCQTSLWISNGGRSYRALVVAAPRRPRHRGGAAATSATAALASSAPNALSAARLPHRGRCSTRRRGGRPLRPRRHPGAGRLERDRRHPLASGGSLTLTDVGGETRTVPFDTGFFGES